MSLANFRGTTKPAVLEAFVPYTKRFEGETNWMYADIRNLVTTGWGDLIDPIGRALSLPWRRLDGQIATPAEIIACWNLVKSRTDLNQRGGMIYSKIAGNDLRLRPEDVEDLVARRLTMNEVELKSHYWAFNSWPADAQLGIHSMAWAMGPAFHFPAFAAAVNATPPDFRTAASESHMSNGAPGRNQAQYRLFMAAADVATFNLDPDVVHGWPEPPENVA